MSNSIRPEHLRNNLQKLGEPVTAPDSDAGPDQPAKKRNYPSGKTRQNLLDEQAKERRAAQKITDEEMDDRVQRSIKDHGA